MYINFARKFKKSYDKAPYKIRESVNNRLKLFKQNTLHPFLNNHQLSGKYEGLRSINITGDWRAIYEEIDKDTVYFLELGTHSQLYK
ncbi:type II toxin-antitoxin system mRNA interferase toxin, RelE/StbE family [Candidatus Roizmanbacteria bacterium]|nr:type II toxin-antitoxin system mRNA interferase toxin, RelE/StbE family [Candidatus Roizmanbacteria bacterium]